MTSGWPGAPYFGSYGRELVSKPEISLGKSWGGYRRMILLKNSVFGGDLNAATTGNVFLTKLLELIIGRVFGALREITS